MLKICNNKVDKDIANQLKHQQEETHGIETEDDATISCLPVYTALRETRTMLS